MSRWFGPVLLFLILGGAGLLLGYATGLFASRLIFSEFDLWRVANLLLFPLLMLAITVGLLIGLFKRWRQDPVLNLASLAFFVVDLILGIWLGFWVSGQIPGA